MITELQSLLLCLAAVMLTSAVCLLREDGLRSEWEYEAYMHSAGLYRAQMLDKKPRLVFQWFDDYFSETLAPPSPTPKPPPPSSIRL